MSSPVHFCSQPPSATSSLTAVRPVPARRRRLYDDDDHGCCSTSPTSSSSSTHRTEMDTTNDGDVDGMDEECSSSSNVSQNKKHHRISSFPSGSSFTVYEGRTFPSNQVTSSLYSTTTASATSTTSSSSAAAPPSSLPEHPLVCNVKGSSKSSSFASHKKSNNQNENFFLRPLLHQPSHGNTIMNTNVHSLSYRQQPSATSSTILRVSPFEPIVNDRNFNGKISPLPQQEYHAWQKRREKQVEEVFYHYQQQHDRHKSMLHGTSIQRPVAVSPMEMDEGGVFYEGC